MSILAILIILIVVSYITIYTKPKKNIEIIQVNDHENFDLSLLNEKQPIIIYDTISDSDKFISEIMTFLYNLKSTNILQSNKIYQNNSKFSFIHNDTEEDLKISISKVTKKINHLNLFYTYVKNDDSQQNDDIDIIIKPGNIFIIPYLFTFKSNYDNLHVKFYNDIFHILSY